MRNATIRDIARATGLNISTVSRSLNGQAGVSAKTRGRVRAVARRLHYRRNSLASGLITRRTRTLGLIFSDVRNPFAAELARGVEDAAFRAGYEVVLCNSDLDPDKELGYVHSLLEKRVDGLMINSVRHGDLDLRPGSVPIVFFNRPRRRRDYSEVTANNFEGGREATRHLIELGHRRIAHLTGVPGHVNLAERCRGFLQALRGAGLKPAAILRGPHSYQGGYELCRRLLEETRPRVPAIFAGNDVLAIGAMRALREAGLRVPQDVSIVGFDDIEIAALLAPPLTTVYQPKYEMGQAAVEVLLRRIAGQDGGVAEHRVLGTRLIVRQSTAKRN